MLVNGEWKMSNDRIEVRNPARPNEIVGTIGRGTEADVDAAVAAAKAAQVNWAKLRYSERASQLREALKRLESAVDDGARLYVRENGKTLKEARGELQALPTRQRLTLSFAEQLEHDHEMPGPTGQTRVGRRPFGVVVSIVPWNSPNSLAFSQIVNALLAGNSVVLKPPETCPLTLIQSVELMAAALPPGLINVVTGLPTEIGDRLTSHPDVGKIGFTGSIASARKIMANAADTIKSVTLELGGNDPAIVLDDVDLSDVAMTRLTSAVFRMTGQVCMAVKRIYVPKSIHGKFVEAFSRCAARLVIGDGLDSDVTMGPLHSKAAQTRAAQLVDDASRSGATICSLGHVKDQDLFRDGYFMRPSMVTDIGDGARLMAEEQFCPAIPIATYDDVDDAIVRANDTIYGLGGSVWGSDIKRALDIGARLEAGTVWVNTHGTEHIDRRAPYGGVKQSGLGRKSGLEGVLEYSQAQTFTSYEQ